MEVDVSQSPQMYTVAVHLSSGLMARRVPSVNAAGLPGGKGCSEIGMGHSPGSRAAQCCRDVPTARQRGAFCPMIFTYIQFEPWPHIGRPAKHDLSTWIVTDDWPTRVPVTDAEIDVFEAWFGDLFDELFGPFQ
jgi:hypothetical protein